MLETAIVCLTQILMALGAAWLLRAGIFGLLADTVRVAQPSLIAVLTVYCGEAAAIPLTSLLVLALFIVFFLLREKVGGDDILISIGMQAAVLGACSLFVFKVLENQNFKQVEILASGSEILVGLTVALVTLTAYLLEFSNFRVVLHNSSVFRRPTSTYPRGFQGVRAAALVGSWACFCMAAMLPMAAQPASLSQWQDGRGILLFGVAYALRGRVGHCTLAAAAIAAVDIISSDVGASGIAAELLAVAPLIVGLLIIIGALSIDRYVRSRGVTRVVRTPAHPRPVVDAKPVI